MLGLCPLFFWFLILLCFSNFCSLTFIAQTFTNLLHQIIRRMKINCCILPCIVIILTCACAGLVPTSQVMLYPNTENSPSLYLISFRTSVDLRANQYILIGMDWLSTKMDPFHCQLANTSISIRCMNLNSTTFTLGFSISTLTSFNPQISQNKTLVIQLLNDLPAGVEYHLEIGLRNLVQNIKKISQSMEIYTLGKDGLIHQINLNFGPVAHNPPITSVMSVSVYTEPNDLSQGVPGTLVTMKVQITITVPVTTPQSAIFVVLQQPFRFSASSYITLADAQQYATNPIPLNSRPAVSFYKVVTSHLFYIAFNQGFVGGRKFILMITEIKNPFFIASSNVSIYSANFNSLTPLQAFERLLPLRTVTQSLTLSLGLPYDMPMTGPCVYYRNAYNYYQVKFNMPIDVPEGYAIKVLALQNSITDGSAYVNFESLDYTTIYDYVTGTNNFVMRKMGPILHGSLITILFRGYKNSITNFYIDVYIDKEAVIAAGATSYMFFGRATAQSQDASNIYYSIRNSPTYDWDRIDTGLSGGDHLRIYIYSDVPTSSGSFFQAFLSPYVQFTSNFNANTDIKISNVADSCNCSVTITANYVRILVMGSTSFLASNPNPFPQYGGRQVFIYNIRFPRPSSNKYPYQIYVRLFNSSAVNAATYIESQAFSVMPTPNTLSASIALTQHGNINSSFPTKYPCFVRFACKNPTVMNYTLQENEIRVISIYCSYGFRDLLTLNNQDQYPCSSSNGITCIYNKGFLTVNDYWNNQKISQLERIDIFFKSGSTETTQNFQIIIPDSLNVASGGSYYYYYYQMGIYNKLTKDFKYLYRNSGTYRNTNWMTPGSNLQSSMKVDFQGKAGSYRSNVTFTIQSSSASTNYQNYIMVSSSFSFFQNTISSYTTSTSASTNPRFYSGQSAPISVYMGSGMYMSIFPFQITSSLSSFTFTVDRLHMPYHYDLPSYYIFVISTSDNNVVSYNQFEMTNQGIFYDAYLASLTFTCLQNSLGVKNTICTIVFGTQNPLKADGKVLLVFKGINVATSTCSLALPNLTKVQSTCSSTSDNKNVTISMVDTYGAYHYPANNFTVTVYGIQIMAQQISQSVTVYLTDSTGQYVIEQGNRILTTTVAIPQNIQIYEITYKYLSPLSANKMTVKFYIPRPMYSDQRLGFVMGKDLSDVNLEVARLRIVLTRSDGTVLLATHQLLSAEYKVLFSFTDSTQVIASNYTLEIYGIMTPVSLQNGAFSIIYQRLYDKAYTLTNAIEALFPSFPDRIISNISMQAFFNTQGYQQKLVFTLINSQKSVNSNTVWIVNFPSYYNTALFNYNPYCLIDSTAIECLADPNTPYQLIIRNSPKRVVNGTTYTISILRLTCPRAKYTNDYYRSYYLFIGVLESIDSGAYVETALLYPEQAIQATVNGILTISDFTVNSLTKPTFSTIYGIIKLQCTVAIPTNHYIFLIFPQVFNNFNNNPIPVIVKVGGVIKYTYNAIVTDTTLQIQNSFSIAATTEFTIQLPSLPTPKAAGQAFMSQMIGYITPSNKKSIIAASSIGGNSAPILTFTADPRYLSFNRDNPIVITSGTYSNMINVVSSDGNPFLTNININLTSAGFTFEPSTLYLRLGDDKGQFRVAADSGLFPVEYFYSTIKTQQMFTYYTITKNNNIQVTDNPVQVTIPSSIDVPIGGCSTPFTVNINNAPVTDVLVGFQYNNTRYNQSVFTPNYFVMKSQLYFTPSVVENFVSFCVVTGFGGFGLPSSFTMKFKFGGTNYQSYQFTPSQNVTINIIAATPPPAIPVVAIQMINRQKTFLDFNITNSLPGTVFYHLQLGQDQPAMDITALQIYLKNNQFIIESNRDYMTEMDVRDRDVRVGAKIRNNIGVFMLRLQDMLPERYYTFCAYLQTFYNVTTAPSCITVQTQVWGQVMKAKVKFSSTISAQNLNNVLCFFTKRIDTQVNYVVDLQGNSCHNHTVKNLHYNYPGQTFNSQNSNTVLYIITNPKLVGDPSLSSFQNMYNSTSLLTTASLNAALSEFAINFLSSTYLGSTDALAMTSGQNADSLVVEFDEPIYTQGAATITVNNVRMSGFGTIYFALVLYKQIHIQGNNSYVKIRLNADPSQHQILNCRNWQNLPAEGCARAVYSYSAQSVTFSNIEPNSMYKLYYMAVSEYPLRPIVASSVQSNSVVTFLWGAALSGFWVLLALAGLVGLL